MKPDDMCSCGHKLREHNTIACVVRGCACRCFKAAPSKTLVNAPYKPDPPCTCVQWVNYKPVMRDDVNCPRHSPDHK